MTAPSSDVSVIPMVSVCIPAYQAERHLQITLESVMSQTYPNLEIVIIDNNSSDGTRDIVDSLNDDRVRVIRNPTTLPQADNFNMAVSQCRGQFVKLVCADDTLDPDCISTQAEVLNSRPEVSLVSTRTDFIDEEGRLLRPARGLRGLVGQHSGERVIRRIIRSGTNPVGPPVAAMFRRVDFDRHGGFRGELLFVLEVDLWVRLIRDGDFFGLPLSLASFRIGGGTVTASISARSQLAQQLEFARRLVVDPRWNVPLADRILGRINSLDMQVRRSGLQVMSALRAARSRRRAVKGQSQNPARPLEAPLGYR